LQGLSKKIDAKIFSLHTRASDAVSCIAAPVPDAKVHARGACGYPRICDNYPNEVGVVLRVMPAFSCTLPRRSWNEDQNRKALIFNIAGVAKWQTHRT
jgi:hypothetical protein